MNITTKEEHQDTRKVFAYLVRMEHIAYVQ
jgi:hypothetical protein